MSEQVTGIVRVFIDGILTNSLDGATIAFGGIQAEPVVGSGRLIGSKESFKEAEVKFTVAHVNSIDHLRINKAKNVVIRYESDEGTVYLVNNARSKGDAVLSGSSGEVPYTFFGDEAVIA